MPMAHTEEASLQFCCYKAEVMTSVTHIVSGRVILLPLPQTTFFLTSLQGYFSLQMAVFGNLCLFKAKAFTEKDELTVQKGFSAKIHRLILSHSFIKMLC